jgi:dihydroflavonol-4-reductase
MRILITGADGMLGSNLVRVLLDRGHEVSVLLHSSSRSITLDGLKIKKYHGDILKPETLHSAVAGKDAVIHAAASTSIWPNRSENVRRINIVGTRNIIDTVLNHKIKLMVYIGSGSSVNGNGNSSGKYAFPGEKYGLDYIDSKYEALNMVMNAVKTKGLPAFAILPTYMIGAYDSLPGSGKMILTFAKGKLKFYTNGGKNFVYVKDVSVAIANSLEMGRIGQAYIAGNKNLTYQSFLSKVAKIVAKPEPKIRIPNWLANTIGLLGSLSGHILKKQPFLTYALARISCDKQFVCSRATVKELNMPHTDIEVAIRECHDWFIENAYLKKTVQS